VTKSKRLPKLGDDNIPLITSYRLLGVAFQLNAKTLLKTLETKADGTPAKYTAIPFIYLVSHAAELYLKAALLKRGYTEGDLKKFGLRHDLKALLLALRAKGVSFSPETVSLLNGLHAQHHSHALRYTVFMQGQRTFMPPLTSTLEMLDELMMLTRISTQGV
jgi:hypothetical protein